MASRISTLDLVKRVRQFALNEPTQEGLDALIQNAIVMADRELRVCDSLSPLAWDIVPWDGLRTVCEADISAITQADPGIVTAESSDQEVTGHGFPNHATVGSIVYIDNLDGMEELNNRFFLLTYIDATTFSLKTLDGLDDVDTSALSAYVGGGTVYHMGAVLNTTTILGSVTAWGFKDLLLDSVTFDGYGSQAITEREIKDEREWITAGGRPERVRYWQYLGNTATTHNLLWYGYPGDQYNVAFNYVKEVPDISTWDDDTYPHYPAEIHEYLWHGGLAQLVGAHEKAKRMSAYDREFGNVEIMFAQRWLAQWEADKIKVREMSRRMLAHRHSWAKGVSA